MPKSSQPKLTVMQEALQTIAGKSNRTFDSPRVGVYQFRVQSYLTSKEIDNLRQQLKFLSYDIIFENNGMLFRMFWEKQKE